MCNFPWRALGTGCCPGSTGLCSFPYGLGSSVHGPSSCCCSNGVSQERAFLANWGSSGCLGCISAFCAHCCAALLAGHLPTQSLIALLLTPTTVVLGDMSACGSDAPKLVSRWGKLSARCFCACPLTSKCVLCGLEREQRVVLAFLCFPKVIVLVGIVMIS